ncbi:hypothetical protein [Synechococcus phage Yong-M3-232]|nr:hypothetical protein [Synechococcus phage Yong-M3-232]
MAKVKNIAPGSRGAWQGATLVMAEPGQVIEADDFEPEWFEEVEPAKVKPKPAPAKAEAKE